MHVVTTRRHYRAKDGTERVSEAHLLRRSYRQAGKVKTRTLRISRRCRRWRSRRCTPVPLVQDHGTWA